MAKSYGAIFLLTLIVLFMLQTMVMASSGSNVKWSQKRYGPGSLKRTRKFFLHSYS
ncbi:hypothetical protein AXX17_AT5G14720 [Arabidopsis thaliana]|uniref:Transmembrane protein n=1 Tax=Arabidopsis thaliana TaxID=3702 RepID=A0A178UPH2_ARATH|nr:hypothetical protein AXX17_AT5G14720 [Arabidopsis thaliana]